MKLKEKPEDFRVEEINGLKGLGLAENRGNYSCLLLEKKNLGTVEAVNKLAKRLRIKRGWIGFAGNKDKKAWTKQYISARKRLKKDFKEEIKAKGGWLKVSFMSYLKEPISLGDLKGNKFMIVIRDLFGGEVEKIKKRVEEIQKGEKVVNYFGKQRFSKNNEKIGLLLLKKEYGLAAEKLAESYEKVREFLAEKPNDKINAIRQVPKKTLKLFIHAVQSSIWNAGVKKMIEEGVEELEEVALVGFGTTMRGKIKKVIEKEMAKRNIDYTNFVIKSIPNLSSAGGTRKIFMEIKDLEIKEEGEDELNQSKKKLKVSFFLSKGSYATMLVENLIKEKI